MTKISRETPEPTSSGITQKTSKNSAIEIDNTSFFPRLSTDLLEMKDASIGPKKTIESLFLSNGCSSFSVISTPKRGLLPIFVVIGENEPKSSLYIMLPEELSGKQRYSADVFHEGKSIGTLIISDYGDYIWVDHVSNLTGKEYRGVGTALQELIFRYSLTHGYSGKVQLDAQGADSSAFHQHLGYEFLNGTTKGAKGAEQGEMYLPDMRIQQIINHNLMSD